MANSKNQPYDLASYWNIVGTDNIKLVIAEVQSSIPYFRVIKIGRKNISPVMAERIIAAARKHTPGFEPDFEMMVRPKPKYQPNPARGVKIGPSPEFLAAQQPEGVLA